MATYKDKKLLTMRSQRLWENWLEKNYRYPETVWLKFAKKGSEKTTLSYEEARESAIAWGWIDGLINKFDDDYYVLRFSARRPRSKWSQINRKIAEELLRKKGMKPSGKAEVDAAKKDGRWDAAYPSQSQITVPDDFRKALSKKAKANFEGLVKSQQYKFLIRIHEAKRADTRERRIKKFAAMLERGETL
ncbi:MAG: YdeI/OmpD-associated family protein [Myxococcota bacterium]